MSLGMFFPWANWKGALTGTLSALAFTLWLCIGATVAITKKQIIVPKSAVSVDGCEFGNFTVPPSSPEVYGPYRYLRDND